MHPACALSSFVVLCPHIITKQNGATFVWRKQIKICLQSSKPCYTKYFIYFLCFTVTADDIQEELWRENCIDVSTLLNDEDKCDVEEIEEYVCFET